MIFVLGSTIDIYMKWENLVIVPKSKRTYNYFKMCFITCTIKCISWNQLRVCHHLYTSHKDVSTKTLQFLQYNVLKLRSIYFFLSRTVIYFDSWKYLMKFTSETSLSYFICLLLQMYYQILKMTIYETLFFSNS